MSEPSGNAPTMLERILQASRDREFGYWLASEYCEHRLRTVPVERLSSIIWRIKGPQRPVPTM